MKFTDLFTESRYIKFSDTRPKAVFTDLKESREYRVYNECGKLITGYRVDGGIITSLDISKCDFALSTEDDRIFLIELKGGNYKKALEQISNTVDLLIKNTGVTAKEVNGRIVLSKYKAPALFENEEKRLIAKLKKYGGNLRKKGCLLEEKI